MPLHACCRFMEGTPGNATPPPLPLRLLRRPNCLSNKKVGWCTHACTCSIIYPILSICPCIAGSGKPNPSAATPPLQKPASPMLPRPCARFLSGLYVFGGAFRLLLWLHACQLLYGIAKIDHQLVYHGLVVSRVAVPVHALASGTERWHLPVTRTAPSPTPLTAPQDFRHALP